MQITIRKVTGKMVVLPVEKSDTIATVLNKLQPQHLLRQTVIAQNRERLVYRGTVLDPDRTVHDYSLSEKSELHQIIQCLDGGGSHMKQPTLNRQGRPISRVPGGPARRT